MSHRLNIFGKGQGLDGDLTSTGSTCIASQARGRVHGRDWLLEGDKTTPCPRCGKEGTIIRGEVRWRQDNIPTAVDGTVVQCGCPLGSNVVVAPLHQWPPPKQASAPQGNSTFQSAPSPSPRHTFTAPATATMPGSGLEPGFYIVPRSMSFNQVLNHLSDQHGHLPISRLQRLNPTHSLGFKAGEIFVIGDPDNGHACTREEAQLMAAAEQARDALATLTVKEADFMMRHQAEIAGLLSDVSLSMGVAQAMMARAVDDLRGTLRNVELLHQREFAKHGHLRNPAFFAERKKLFTQIDGQLKAAFLKKRMNLGSHETLKRDLGISSKSLVHHWSKAGGPGQIPGYATHLEKLASMSKYLKTGGQIGIVLGAGASYFKIKEACEAGNASACKKIKFTEAGSFAGGLTLGSTSGWAASRVAGVACISLAGVSLAVCSVAIVGAGALTMGTIGSAGGEWLGEVIYESVEDE